MKKPINLDQGSFDDEISTGASIVDFYATWCPPCKALAPKLDLLAEKTAGDMTVAKVDIDLNKELAKKYNVRSIPTIIVFKDGSEVKRVTGNVSLKELETLTEL